MKSEVKALFLEKGIEYFAAVDYSECREIAPHIIEKAGFLPKSVLVYLIPYYVSTPKNLSIYATSLDYHIFISEFSTGNLLLIASFFKLYFEKVSSPDLDLP